MDLLVGWGENAGWMILMTEIDRVMNGILGVITVTILLMERISW